MRTGSAGNAGADVLPRHAELLGHLVLSAATTSEVAPTFSSAAFVFASSSW
jgi:hypothetical protein